MAIPYSWYTVEAGVNNQLYFIAKIQTGMVSIRYPYLLAFPTDNLDGDGLVKVMQMLINDAVKHITGLDN